MIPSAGPLPLEGIRVLELGHIIAGPAAGLILADLGAEVIKVERPDGGDQARQMAGGARAYFYLFNRNKRDVAINVKSPGGREIIQRLVKRSDVVIDNFAAGVLERLDLGYEQLSALNPGLIYLSIKGFLPGPYEHRPALDELAQMMGGLAYMTGPEGQPLRAGASIIDIGAATYGVLGILAALRQRDRTGLGQKITSGLFETSVFWVGQWMAVAAATGQPSIPMPGCGQGVRMGWGIFHLFETADHQQLFIGVTSNAHWKRFCQALDLPDLLADQRLSTNPGRVAAQDWLLPRIRQETARYSSAELQAKLTSAGVPNGPVRRPDQLMADQHLLATDQLMDTPIGEFGPHKLPKLPFRSSAYNFQLRRPAPELGQHTGEILTELGYTPERIQQLRQNGSISLPSSPSRSEAGGQK
jgi:crotonobetainyl-CoA:carnitine CoA-transferase CaiB-like acyl-CoA transferase